MSAHKNCRSELVAQTRFSSITRCPGCNNYCLHIGPMTFRMEGEVFGHVCEMILELYIGKTETSQTLGNELRRH